MTNLIIAESYNYDDKCFIDDIMYTNGIARFTFTGGSVWSVDITGNFRYAVHQAKKMYQRQFNTKFGEIVLISASKINLTRLNAHESA